MGQATFTWNVICRNKNRMCPTEDSRWGVWVIHVVAFLPSGTWPWSGLGVGLCKDKGKAIELRNRHINQMMNGTLACTCDWLLKDRTPHPTLSSNFFLSQQTLKATYTQGLSVPLFHEGRNSKNQYPSVTISLVLLTVNSTVTLHHYRLTGKASWLVICTDRLYI